MYTKRRTKGQTDGKREEDGKRNKQTKKQPVQVKRL